MMSKEKQEDLIYELLRLAGVKAPSEGQIENIFVNLNTLELLAGYNGDEDVYSLVKEALYPIPKPSFEALAIATASEFGVSLEDILGTSRGKNIARARHMLVYIIRDCLSASFPEIAKYLNRDHSTIMASYQKVVEEIDPNDTGNFWNDKYFAIIERAVPKQALII